MTRNDGLNNKAQLATEDQLPQGAGDNYKDADASEKTQSPQREEQRLRCSRLQQRPHVRQMNRKPIQIL
jgi:hypothetical protein